MRYRRRLITGLREIALVAGLLAFGVIAWEHALHAYFLGHDDTLAGNIGHWLRDAALALPVALAASAIALLWARMLRLGDSTLDLFARGSLAALLFGLLLVPSAPIHNQIDAATGA